MIGGQQWYFASLLFGRDPSDSDGASAKRCSILLTASNPDQALTKSQAIGGTNQDDGNMFLGVDELLAVDSEITDGVELVWREETVMKDGVPRVMDAVLRKEAFQNDTSNASGWCLGEILLMEVIEDRPEDQEVLVWKNTYLLEEASITKASERLTQIGHDEQDNGEHLSDGYRASWRFMGISKLIDVLEKPGDGSFLSCESLEVSPAQLKLSIPRREELGVFQWLSARCL